VMGHECVQMFSSSESDSSASSGSTSEGVVINRSVVQDSIWEDYSIGGDFFDDFDSYYLGGA
jgi:hypothetical protein